LIVTMLDKYVPFPVFNPWDMYKMMYGRFCYLLHRETTCVHAFCSCWDVFICVCMWFTCIPNA